MPSRRKKFQTQIYPVAKREVFYIARVWWQKDLKKNASFSFTWFRIKHERYKNSTFSGANVIYLRGSTCLRFVSTLNDLRATRSMSSMMIAVAIVNEPDPFLCLAILARAHRYLISLSTRKSQILLQNYYHTYMRVNDHVCKHHICRSQITERTIV